MKKNIQLNLRVFLLFLSVCAFSQEKPNIIWVITDEHNFRTIGSYRVLMDKEQALQWGDEVVDTPNLDWLANNGALFTSMYAASPVCSPSRASMFTGQYPHTVDMPLNNKVMSKKHPTIANILNNNGYRTGYVGKWHLSGTAKPGWAPDSYGFTDNQFMFNRGHWKKFGIKEDGTPFVAAVNKKGEPTYLMNGADENSYSTDWLMNRAIDFIDKDPKNPFFCVLSLPEPHGPDAVRAPYKKMYKDVKFNMPRTFTEARTKSSPVWRKFDKKVNNPKKMQNMIQTYFGSVKCIDDNIGKLISSLKKKGILENTIIIFSSDHGDLLGEHNQVDKGAPYEASALIPFIMYYGNQIKPKTIVRRAVNTTDWMSTTLTLAGVKKQPKIAGRDLTPLLSKATSKNIEDITFSRIDKRWLTAITDRYKLAIDVSKSEPWLFDTEKDPDELINFYGKPGYEKITLKLAKKMQDYIQKEKDPFADKEVFMNKLKTVLLP